MTKRHILLVTLFLALLFSPSLFAQSQLVSLSINEDIVPGPRGVYLTVTGHLTENINQQIREGLVWYSSDASIAEVSQSGWLRFTGKGGTVTITVYKGSVSGRKTIQVKPWPESLTIETSLDYSPNPYRLLAKGRFSDGTTRHFGPEDGLQWSSSNPWVAWVNSQGVVTFTGEEGYVRITATVGQYSDSRNTTVNTGNGETRWRRGIKIKEEIKYSSQPQKLTLVAVMNDQTEEDLPASGADWSSSHQDIATINNEGELRFTGKPGFTTIKVSYGGYHYEKVAAVDRFLEKILINESLNYTWAWEGVPLPLSVTARYNDGSEIKKNTGVTWSVDNNKIAQINEEGKLTFSGTPGKVTVKVTAKGVNEETLEDSLTVEVPTHDKPVPQRLLLELKPIFSLEPLEPKVYCVYNDGTLRDVTAQAVWSTSTPETMALFQDKFYVQPVPGPMEIGASYQGLFTSAKGYVDHLSGKKDKVYQLRIREMTVPYSPKPVQLTSWVLLGDGSRKNVSGQVNWRSTQPLVVKVSKGTVTFTGRPGKAKIIAEGFGLRDEINIEVTPGEIQPRLEKITLAGDLSKWANQLKVMAHYNNGSSRDVTKEAIWNTSNKNKAMVTPEGLVMFPQGPVSVRIKAYYQGMETGLSR